jgi:hypothetical protein
VVPAVVSPVVVPVEEPVVAPVVPAVVPAVVSPVVLPVVDPVVPAVLPLVVDPVVLPVLPAVDPPVSPPVDTAKVNVPTIVMLCPFTSTDPVTTPAMVIDGGNFKSNSPAFGTSGSETCSFNSPPIVPLSEYVPANTFVSFAVPVKLPSDFSSR